MVNEGTYGGVRIIDVQIGQTIDRVVQPPGVVVAALASAAELRGQIVRSQAEQTGRTSPAGLLLENLNGRISEADLHQRLQARGLPLPAPKLVWTPPRKVVMPPMRWRLEWEQQLLSNGNGASEETVSANAQATSVAEPPPRKLEIHAMGRLRLLAAGEDHAPTILRRPLQSILFLYLLVREARKPGDWITRAALADELSPGLDPEQQRLQLRYRLGDVRSTLPPPLLERVKTEGEYIGLDLSDCSFDVRWLKELAKDAADTGELLPPALEREIEEALPVAAEESLPGWEEIETRMTKGKGTASDVVGEVRAEMEVIHAGLLVALADACLARRDPGRAVRYLEEGMRRRADHEGIAMKLITAYEQSGQHKNAAKLRVSLGLTEAS